MTSISDNFPPTFLYVKRHKVTGLLYFGKTTNKDVNRYKGSGTHWVKHINKHGKEYVETVWVEKFYNLDELVEFALFFSEFYDIVKSNEWANCIPENGLDGYPAGLKRSLEHCLNIAKSKLGIKQTPEHIKARTDKNTGQKRSEEFCKYTSERQIGHEVKETTIEKLRNANLGKKYSPEINSKKASAKGKIWITDGVNRCYLDQTSPIPSGWRRGMK